PPPPEPFEDPRFTYVPRWRSESFPNGQSEEDFTDPPVPPPAAEPHFTETRETEAREQEQIASDTTPVAFPRKLPRRSLRTQLILIALAPILVGSAIAYFAALLSPTLFAARSEIV